LNEENSPSCLDTKCGQCQGCDFWTDIEKEFSQTLEVRAPEKPAIGRPTNNIFRYQAFYVKTGPARFVSHHDLMNILHRAFRRTGIAAVYSEGFHPKMQMSFVPALPLGMEGKDESLEFRSYSDMAEEEFVSALNRNVPAGILFTALRKIDRQAPSLSERIQSMVYSLDMTSEKVQEALGAMGRADGEGHQDPWAVAEKRVEGYLLNKNDWVESVRLDTESRKLILRLRFATQRSIRPQDLAAQIFDLKEAVSMMARDKIILAAPEPRPSQRASSVIDRP
jgi:radical SAM-linked protein